jgi:siderophore synthetase component
VEKLKTSGDNVAQEPVVAESLATLASRRILQELVDALILENLFALQEKSVLLDQYSACRNYDGFHLDSDEYYCCYGLADDAGELVFRVKKQPGLQPFRLSRTPVVWFDSGGQARQLDATLLMQCLVSKANDAVLPNISGVDRFMRDLAIAEAQTGWALAAAERVLSDIEQGQSGLLLWERLAALRERPFHPLARAKVGWSATQYRNYSTEAGESFGLSWLAVRNDRLIGSSELRGMAVATLLLTTAERNHLQERVTQQAIDLEHFTLVPAHPWQMEHVLADEFADSIAQDQCILVVESLGAYAPTSSIRSLAPSNVPAQESVGDAKQETHVKLPLAIASLGALRILPPRYLHNGAAAQAVLNDIITRESSLRNVSCCDESRWLGFSASGESLLSNRSGHLTCLLRQYPCLADARGESFPMSAFAVVQGESVPAYERVMSTLITDPGKSQRLLRESAPGFFEALCDQLCTLSFSCFSYGVMPEVHGQNIVLWFEQGRIKHTILRDHDTLRFFPPWMRQAGLQEVDYVMDWSTPNSLVCLSPEELLRYFQTLGVQVNLYAIADALSSTYGIDIAQFWQVLAASVKRQLQNSDIPIFAKAILRRALLDTPVWPARLLLTPYLIKRTQVTGMPSALGSVPNPLMTCI